MNKIFIIGIGPGSKEYVLPIALDTINSCDVIIGGRRNLEVFSEFRGEKILLSKSLEETVEYLRNNRKMKQVGIIVSGDSGFYSILSFMNKYFNSKDLEVIPGISSFQYLFSKLKMPWQEYQLLSLHGKKTDFIKELKAIGKVAILTDSNSSPDKLANVLLLEGLHNITMTVGENLSYPEERIITGAPEEIIAAAPYEMSVVVITNG